MSSSFFVLLAYAAFVPPIKCFFFQSRILLPALLIFPPQPTEASEQVVPLSAGQPTKRNVKKPTI